MPTLIDGYNLAHASGILARNIGPGTLQRARDALIGFLRAALSDSERSATTVVFDAKAAPPDLPSEQVCDGLRVVYAVGYETADALLEVLIRADSAPRRLIVVSSDHQVQRAAKRRRATAVDSEPWFTELQRRRRERPRHKRATNEKPSPPEVEAEIDYWLKVFDGDASAEILPEESEATAAKREPPAKENGKPVDPEAGIENPFPPGYGEDLLSDDEDWGE